MEVTNAQKDVIIRETSYVDNKPNGRFKTFLKVLASPLLFGPDAMWNDLVQKTVALINKKRDERNAPEKPIYKSREQYLKEQKEAQNRLVSNPEL